MIVYYILLCFGLLSSLRNLFSSNERQEVDPDGRGGEEELGEVEGGETVFRIY